MVSGVPKYDKDKYYRIMDMAQSNFSNQLKRVSKDAKRADFILCYYSIALIGFSLSTKYYPQWFNSDLCEYSSIILSVILLTFSVINSKSRYPERMAAITAALNTTKRLKREVGALSDNPDQMETLLSINSEYEKVIDAAEMRDDLDFFATVKARCSEHNLSLRTGKEKKCRRKGTQVDSAVVAPKSDYEENLIKETRGYISELNYFTQKFHILVQAAWHIMLYALPAAVLVLSIIVK